MTRAVERLGRAWAVLSWKHWAWATALAVLLALTMVLLRFDVSNYWAGKRIVYHGPWYALFAYIFLLAIAWVESTPGDPAPGLWRYASAALCASLLCVALVASLALHVPYAPCNVVEGLVRPPPKGVAWETRRRVFAVLDPGMDGAMFGFLATMIYARLRNARRLALTLARAELGRSEASRALLGAQLAAASAAIDPGEVIERLDAIARMYEKDSRAADAQLDELIEVLRAAIPRIRQESTTPA